MKQTALALFSGGLDSILSCRLIASLGINVVALKFVSPFFDFDLLNQDNYTKSIKEKYDIDVVLHDISEQYIELLRAPKHGYGKHFNPCIDCKIFMMSKARMMMADYNASFLISGEVVGQRPMSQRRDALRLVERDSGCGGLLLRPLCAKNLEPTIPEINGIVDRERLCGFSGRSRAGQMQLAKQFGISDYPTPAGGCVLTDPVLGERIKQFYAVHPQVSTVDMRLITVGRQFSLPDGAWLALGRKESENSVIESLITSGDILLKIIDRPGPSALLRNMQSKADLEIAAGVVARYGKKDRDGRPFPGRVECVGGDIHQTIDAIPLADSVLKEMQQ